MTNELRAGRALDAACATALGLQVEYSNYNDGLNYRLPTEMWRAGGEKERGWAILPVPHYSTSADGARQLEYAIEEQGGQMVAAYVFALAESLFGADDEWGTAHVMKMMRATPSQRARAFLKAAEAN